MVFYIVVGKLCSGKSIFIKYCEQNFNYKVIDFQCNHIDFNKLENEDHFEQIKQKWANNKIEFNDFFNQYILKNIDRNVIFQNVRDIELIEKLKELTYVKIIYIDSCIEKRWQQYCKKYENGCQLIRFIQLDDYVMNFVNEQVNYELQQNVIYETAHIKIMNNSRQVREYIDLIEQKCVDLIEKPKYRPSWDDYFMKIAHICKIRSNCLQNNQGALLVQSNRIVSTGYVGTPGKIQNCFEGGCNLCQCPIESESKSKNCYCVHPIENILLEAGIKNAKGGTVYVTEFPCIWCTKLVISASIARVVYSKGQETQGEAFQAICKAGIDLTHYKSNSNKIF